MSNVNGSITLNFTTLAVLAAICGAVAKIEGASVAGNSSAATANTKPTAQADKAAVQETKVVTGEELKALVMAANKKLDKDKFNGLMKSTGCKSMPEILAATDKYGEIAAKVEAALAAG